jgi:hypothetical protein
MIAYGAHRVIAHETPLKAIRTVPPTCVSTRRVENMTIAKEICAKVQIWEMSNLPMK